MQGSRKIVARTLRTAMFAVLVLASACAVRPPDPMPEPDLTGGPELVDVGPPLRPEPLPRPAAPTPLPEVAIVLTSRQPAYEQVANELGAMLEKFTIYDISDRSQPPVTAFRQINDSESKAEFALTK